MELIILSIGLILKEVNIRQVFSFILSNWHMLTFTGLTTSQIASSVFTLGTAAVLPFYTLMIFAPKAELVKFLIITREISFIIILFY